MKAIGLFVILTLTLSAALGEEYKPGLGDFMLVVQQHHAKLYFAGQAQNWDLASYELDELQETFEDAAQYNPKFKNLKTPIPDLISAMITPSLKKVQDAITGRNRQAFGSSFAVLTNSCNACHKAAEHPFIVIQTPNQPEFTNQKFAK